MLLRSANEHSNVLGTPPFPASGHADKQPSAEQSSICAVLALDGQGSTVRARFGPAPHVAILATHRTSNYMGYHGCRELAKRGFLVLCMNPRSDNNEALVRWEDNALDVRSGMTFLRAQPGITKVLLWGFSGGGTTWSFYQAVAENGTNYCKGATKLIQCGEALHKLPPADGLILVDANPGNAAMALGRMKALSPMMRLSSGRTPARRSTRRSIHSTLRTDSIRRVLRVPGSLSEGVLRRPGRPDESPHRPGPGEASRDREWHRTVFRR